MRTVVREEALVGWYLRVHEPGRVPTSGTIAVVESHPVAVTVAAVQAAVNDRGNTYPELAALDPLSPNMRSVLTRAGRDGTGGVPEAD